MGPFKMAVYYAMAPGSTNQIFHFLIISLFFMPLTCTYILLLTFSYQIFASFPPGYFRHQSCAPIHDIRTLPTQHIVQVRHRKWSPQFNCKRLPSHWSRAGLHQDHLVGRLFVTMPKMPQYNNKTRNEEGLVKPAFCIVDTGSSCFYQFSGIL